MNLYLNIYENGIATTWASRDKDMNEGFESRVLTRYKFSIVMKMSIGRFDHGANVQTFQP